MRRAFTLIEILVAMLVFSLFLGVIVSSFLHLSRNFRDANQKRKVYIEARQLTDMFTQELRLGLIDYDCYITAATDGITNRCDQITPLDADGVTNALVILKNESKERVFFRKNGEQIEILKQKKDLSGVFQDSEGYTNWLPLLSSRFLAERLYFRIWPVDNPYLAGLAPNDQLQYQPKVAVFMTLKTYSSLGPDPFDLVDIQTTVSSRKYGKQ